MRYLKTNTATIVTVGPFLDKTDGVTLETGLTITNERISFVVDLNDGSAPTLVLDNVTGATSGTSNDLNYITGCDAGLMQLELAAANVNYLGRAFLTVTDAANHCPVFHEFTILPAMVYDSLIAGTDVLQSNMTQIAGSAVSTSTAQLGVNVVQAAGTAWGSGAITAASIAADAITAAKIAAGAIDNATFAADVGSTAYATNIIALAADKAIQNYGALKPTTAGRTLDVTATGAAGIDWGNIENPTTAVDLAGTGIDSAVNVTSTDSIATGGISSTSFAANSITAAALATDVTTEIQSGLATAASIAALNNLSAAQVNTEVDTALADIHLDHLLAVDYDPASKPGTATALLNELIGSDAGVSQFTANALELAPSGGGGVADWTADERTALRAILGIPASGTTPEVPSAGALKVIDDFLDTEIAAILADTNELQTDWANGGRLDLLLDGAASAGDPWTTALPGAYGAGSAGKIIGDNINAPIGTIDTVVDAIKAKTDYLPSATAGAAGGVFIAGSNAAVAANITGNITGNLSGSVGSVTGAVGSVSAGGITASSIATGAIDADALAADAVDEILDEVVEGSTTLRQAMRALLSLAAGKSSRSGSTIYLRDIGDTKNRVAITHDSNADRTAVTVDLT